MQRLREIFGARPVAAVLVTVVTLAIIGGVLFSTTTVACGPAQKAGLKLQHCAARPVAARVSPSPTAFPSRAPYPSSQPYTPPASEPYTPPASQPYYPPSSGYCPPDSGPYCPGSSGPYPPDGPGPASGSYPPFQPPATGAAGLAIPGYQLSCRLPIYVGPSGSGGFIVFPGGNFIADPSSAVTLPTPPGYTPPPQAGYGPGISGLTYDTATSTWLPVARNQVAPDGGHYVFPSATSLYVVDARTKSVTEVGQGHQWNIIGVVNDAVYAEVPGAPGLWKLPFSGAATQIISSGFWQLASPSAAYGTASSSLPQGVTTTIMKLDLATAQLNTSFYSREGTSSGVIGFDAHGNPLIQVNYFAQGGGSEVWLVSSTGAIPLFGSGSYGQGLILQGTPAGDSHGVWMPLYVQSYTGGNGFGLYVPNSGVYWMSNYGGQLAGGCS